jgi:hypothetical protein
MRRLKRDDMLYFRSVVKKRAASLTFDEWVQVTARMREAELAFRRHRAPPPPPAKVTRVLCWWCREYHSPAEVEACMALPRKVAGQNGAPSSTSSALEKGLFEQFSELWEFLQASSYSDGTKRRTGRISLSCDAGLLSLILTDVETGQYACLTGRNPSGLFEEAELRLADGSLSWRPSRFTKGRP